MKSAKGNPVLKMDLGYPVTNIDQSLFSKDCGLKLRTGAGKWLVDFNGGKTQLVSFDRFNNTAAIDVKMDGYILEEKSYFKMCLQEN